LGTDPLKWGQSPVDYQWVKVRPTLLPIALAVLAAASAPVSAAPAAAAAASVAAAALRLGPDDLRIEQRSDGGYHLFVRAKKGLGSILLTESTADPSGKADTFAFRSLERNEVNGGEARMLDGKKLSNAVREQFLIDSSLEPDAVFGRAYHIFIPWVVVWGYSWSRSGKVFIHDGTFINIRAFAKPYADYSGAFSDNPYLVRVTQALPPSTPLAASAAPAAAKAPPAAAPAPAAVSSPATSTSATAFPLAAVAATSFKRELYIPETLAAFASIAKASGGELRYASSDKDIALRIDELLAREKGKSLDLVLCVDSTDSMIGGVAELRSSLPALLAKRASDFPALRIGLIAYKDYFEEYLYKRLDFSSDIPSFSAELSSIECGGGRDIPEAVYEALYAAIDEYPWDAGTKLLVLVGDAPPHPLPRGSIAESDVEEAAREAGIEISCVAVPK
jgi:hypothetical protein